MTYQSEAQLEKNMIEQLVHQGYKPITINNYDALIHNFRNQLNNFNKKKLDGHPLTDSEFSRFLTQIDGKSIFETAKILRDKQVFQRDDGTEIYLELFNKREWCKNFFQVTHQTTVEGKYKNRYDVTILINGLPVIQVELKRRGLDFKEAFNQIQRYRKHSFRGLYRFLQLFVVSNGVDTKYFANSDGDMLFGYTFYWSDAENNRITTLNEFTESFLEKCHMAKMIARYMILNDTEKKLMVMRPYQVFAVESLLKRALETKNNGYIWHTTGSGKTLTSFKASQLLSNEPSIKKVFFLVDRKDLDSQTSEEFNKFEPDSVDETDKTDNLVQQIADMTKPLILTTIQKMANAVKNKKYEEVMAQYRNERVIFIIDECHRSQFGDMHKEISKHFQQAQYFGFTGTPRFEKNKSQDGRVTADLFEKCLHTYLIKDAIQDGNVLGFSVEYIKTMDIEFYEEDKSRVKGIETDEIWMHDDRLELIAQNIIDNHERRAKSKGYTAIFTVQNIPMLVKYYDIFKKLDHNLKITGIFTYGANEDSESRDEHSRDALERIITDYNKQFGKNFSTDKFQGYFKDVSKGVKTAQIDILLVVEMFLTGFDSKKLNTLYVDRNLKYHGLVQAYSRTNRVDKATKPYGNIVCFRNLKENTDEAIRLFSETDSVNDVLMKSYEEYLNQFKAALANVYALADSPASVDQLEREEDKHDFIVSFRELTKNLVSLQTFTDFEFDAEELGIEEQTYQDYKSKYLRIYDETKKKDVKESILANVDFSIELMHTDRINVSYIMNLIRNINFDDEEEREKTIKTIEDELNRADNEELRLKVDLIKSFLRKVVPTMTSADSVDDTYNEFEQEERVKEIEVFAKEFNVSKEMLQSFIEEYEYSGIIKNQEISDNIKLPLLKKKKLLQRIISFISEHTKRFS
ncbi:MULTISPECIES: type I restriction endonuclease subunit R [Bacillus]|uniref:type I restriction endonuclease subunit R n=2 Tax=Bacillaceae TaxID=186817 RepID=UPI0007781BEF|nr:type I restriction endonuclease subunit R [Bacillus paranthracis]KXY05900.1 restriction endonuclease subunit R [Bacillus cereus]MCU5210360.1 type I restriction endonuclease subunit R [Bacillus paranthracis]HDR7174638.1 type I restriction endonuclease subunit R [Bacillus cereus]HDR7972965.1 type I restriction endonuclease subunit R [Bacillus cereus]